MPPVPFKLNQDYRHHIPRQQHKVTNWPAYEASLRQRGSLTMWFTDDAVAAWAAAPRTTPGGQACYSPLAILTALTLRTVFRLAYRQAEGLIGSIISLLGMTLESLAAGRLPGDGHGSPCRIPDGCIDGCADGHGRRSTSDLLARIHLRRNQIPVRGQVGP
jgi:hypothetical protein